MKKSLIFAAAASALMLTACSSENDVVQSAPQTQETAAKALDFDVYMPQTANVTRTGEAGVMTTEKLKKFDGFGVFAFYHNDGGYTTGTETPNFMYNQQVTWAGGWSYSPLKYWPNETTSDMLKATGHAVSDATDKLSFFAYAPYVVTGVTGTGKLGTKDNATMDIGGSKISAWHASETSGILAISAQDYDADPKVEWKVSANPDNNVDLLWGVAPEGLNYTAVNGDNITTTPGKPIVNMVKPDKDQKIKFLFEHALSRIGLSVVSAIDQVADGGKIDYDQTRVLIESVKLYGNFGTEGVLNLNNETAHKANWIEASVDRTASDSDDPTFVITPGNQYLTPSLRYDATTINTITGDLNDDSDGDADAFSSLKKGVTPSEQPLMSGGPDPDKKVVDPDYSYGTILYKETSGDYDIATATTPASKNVYSKDASGNYTLVSTGGYSVDGSKEYFTLSDEDAIDASTTALSAPANDTDDPIIYWTQNATDANKYDKKTLNYGDAAVSTGTYYLFSNETPVTATYTEGTYYTTMMPRYFMVIPSASGAKTTINVEIKYHIVTKDTKLTDFISNVTNTITKTTSITLENGKSYNLKLILGLTSVKLDATVKDWEVADETELNLPKNED